MPKPEGPADSFLSSFDSMKGGFIIPPKKAQIRLLDGPDAAPSLQERLAILEGGFPRHERVKGIAPCDSSFQSSPSLANSGMKFTNAPFVAMDVVNWVHPTGRSF